MIWTWYVSVLSSIFFYTKFFSQYIVIVLHESITACHGRVNYIQLFNFSDSRESSTEASAEQTTTDHRTIFCQ